MKNRVLFVLAAVGVLAGLFAAFIYSRQKPSEAPVFNPASNPYAKGIYSNGIIESFQTNGENINIFPEVAARVTKILVAEGQAVQQGQPLIEMDDSIQRATFEQQEAQAQAALKVLEELKAQPRKEVLAVNKAQVAAAAAALRNVQDQLAKVMRSYHLHPKSVSMDALDNAINAVKVAHANLVVAKRQYDLTRAGAWIYDIQNQERQYQALFKASMASKALLEKYTIRAPVDGVVLSIRTAVGGYISAQGAYGTYTEGYNPALVMGGSEGALQVRCYVDEILVHRLPEPGQMTAQMYVRGTNISAPLEFVRIQPYVTPKIELSDQRQERVDVRVLPVIFRFERPKGVNLYPGQLVDVYLGEKQEKKQLTQLPGKAAK